MTFLGVNLIVWAISFAIVFGGLLYGERETRKLAIKTKLIRQLAIKKMEQSLSEKRSRERYFDDRYGNWYELPPAYKEANWMRNIYGEPSNENAILASTGCELTDAIYAAAHRAGIDIVEFEKENNHGYK